MSRSIICHVLFTALAGAALAACATESSSPGDPAIPTWEEFEAASTRVVDGKTTYVVEWDLPVTHDQLRAYYREHAARAEPGASEQASTVNVVNGADDVWPAGAVLDLTYCVSTDFGAQYGRAVTEMAQATQGWQAVARVGFRHKPKHDGSCSNANSAVTFAVRPHTGGGACAFFPSGGGCVPRTLVMNFQDLDSNPFYQQNAPNVRTVGVFRHELGHILGLRHEQVRPESGLTCGVEGGTFRGTTAYDRSSVMHYPWCNGNRLSDLSITGLDTAGVQSLYGAPPQSAQPTSGAWWNPARSGNGFDLRVIDASTLIATWLTYLPGGTPVWYLSQATRQGGIWRGDLLSYRWNGATATPTIVGSLSFDFTSTERGTVKWTINNVLGTEPIERLVFGGAPTVPSLSGTWYWPPESGWGLTFETESSTHVAYLLAYAGGAPTWVMGVTTGAGPSLTFPLTRVTGRNLCPGCTGPTSTTGEPAGTMTVDVTRLGIGRAFTSIDAQLAGGPWFKPGIDLAQLTRN